MTNLCISLKYKRHKPFMAHCPKYRTFDRIFNFNLRSYNQKISLWASRLYIGRRKEYVCPEELKKKKKKEFDP